MRLLLRLLAYLWTLPNTLLGCVCALFAVLTGGKAQVVDGVLEAHGGVLRPILGGRMPVIGRAAAMTLGHVVIGQDYQSLVWSRRHERVHVRQYERWGPFFIPAYLLASLVALMRRQNPYRDNPFERQAYQEEKSA